MKHRGAGFTLIEILVVLVIIAMLVSMATLNTSFDGRYDDLKNESEKIKFKLMVASDVALFENKNLGVVFSKTEFQFYSYEVDDSQASSEQSNTANQTTSPLTPPEQYIWKPYTVKNVKVQRLPEGFMYNLEVEGQEVSLPYSLEQDEEDIQPNMYLFASGEQTPITLILSIDDFDAQAHVRGNGLGQFYNEVIREEE